LRRLKTYKGKYPQTHYLKVLIYTINLEVIIIPIIIFIIILVIITVIIIMIIIKPIVIITTMRFTLHTDEVRMLYVRCKSICKILYVTLILHTDVNLSVMLILRTNENMYVKFHM